jgi:hypothetical protein
LHLEIDVLSAMLDDSECFAFSVELCEGKTYACCQPFAHPGASEAAIPELLYTPFQDKLASGY